MDTAISVTFLLAALFGVVGANYWLKSTDHGDPPPTGIVGSVIGRIGSKTPIDTSNKSVADDNKKAARWTAAAALCMAVAAILTVIRDSIGD
jgi:hypothetical protein